MIINALAGNYINVGFSDLMRGSISIDFLCRKYNKSHRISWKSSKNNIHKMYVDYCPDAPLSIDRDKCRIFAYAEETISQLDEFIRTHDSNTTEYIFCNHNTYTETHASLAAPFLRKYATPSNYISSLTDKFIERYNLDNFEILHFRTNDKYTRPHENHISMILNLKWDRPVVFLSNNLQIKEIIKQHSNYIIFDNIPTHTGFGDNNTDYTDTFIEWNLVCKSKKITTISMYNWGSGFTFFPALMHNILLENIIIDNIL